ncbi:hypothetical protein chiPu_0012623 [Chiloscyllium punctatum]|uniref:TNFR-Cys domain-containing protein n=1 Tax=Chiloscyllium punctatum TaxID=137246 RepID=A0A401SUU0_CHIPU|nr:hypothetical protein [Chiloscyllium punctatum]
MKGTYKVSSSSYSSNDQTQCAPCEEGTYTEKENSLKECRKCYGPCTGNSIETVQCTPTTNRKCECDFHYYCVTDDPAKCEHCRACGDKKPLLSGKSFTSFMVWIVVPLAILCVIITMRTSLCKVSKKQGIGMLVKLKFICICGVKSDIYKGSRDEAEINAGAVPEAEEQCLNGLNSDSKPATAMMPLISNKTNEAPMYKSDILDIETVSVVVHPKDSTEDNIPFPVQENGRNSNTYYPIEEQNQKQYSEPVTMGSKNSTQTSEYFKNNK